MSSGSVCYVASGLVMSSPWLPVLLSVLQSPVLFMTTGIHRQTNTLLEDSVWLVGGVDLEGSMLMTGESMLVRCEMETSTAKQP